MADLRKYGVATHFYKPIIKRGVVDFAVGADWTPSAGDVKISKDGGATANVTNLPAAIAMGNTAMWDFSMTATEMQAAKVNIMVADSVTKAVEDQMIECDTYGNASAQFTVDIDASNSNIKKNQALATFPYVMIDTSTKLPVTGKTVTCTRSIDGGAFTAGTLANVAELSNGTYLVDFGAGDLNGNCIMLRATASGCDDTLVSLVTTP